MRPRVKLSATPKRPQRDKRVRFVGRLAACTDRSERRKLRGTDMVLKRRVGDGQWKVIRRKKLDRDCRTTFRDRASYRKAFYKVQWPKQHKDYRKGRSQEIKIKTRRR